MAKSLSVCGSVSSVDYTHLLGNCGSFSGWRAHINLHRSGKLVFKGNRPGRHHHPTKIIIRCRDIGDQAFVHGRCPGVPERMHQPGDLGQLTSQVLFAKDLVAPHHASPSKLSIPTQSDARWAHHQLSTKSMALRDDLDSWSCQDWHQKQLRQSCKLGCACCKLWRSCGHKWQVVHCTQVRVFWDGICHCGQNCSLCQDSTISHSMWCPSWWTLRWWT